MARRRALSSKKCPSCSEVPVQRWRCERCGGLIAANGFRVQSLISVGPHGRVYQARKGRLPVALKELAFAVVPDVETLERFEREASVLAALEHPLIPRTLASFSDGEGPERRLYLAQQLLDGRDLEQRQKEHFFDEAEARRIAADLLDVLGYLHSRSPQVIHRDVKPANVIALSNGRFALVDFGAVRLSTGNEGASITGTFGFMPPEQLARHADGRSDLYALGMTLACLLSRRSPAELIAPDLTVCFRRFLNVSEPFLTFLDRLLARDPTQRFQDAHEARITLRASEPAPLNLQKTVEFALPPLPQVKAVPKPPPAAAPVVAGPKSPSPKRSGPIAAEKVPEERGGVSWILTIGGTRYRLYSGTRVTIGRALECGIAIDATWRFADTVSRGHAELSVTRAGLSITDLGSTNGTLVGAVLLRGIAKPIQLQEATALRFGSLPAEVRPAFLALDDGPIPPADPLELRAYLVRRLHMLHPAREGHVQFARIREERVAEGRMIDPLSRKRLMDYGGQRIDD